MENKAIENQTGICPMCNRPLRDPKSVVRGIGPVCARKQRENDTKQQQLDLESEGSENI